MNGAGGRSTGRIRRFAALLLGLVALAGLALHVRPLAVWRFTVAPKLADEPNSWRLHVDTVDQFPAAPDSWATLTVDDFRLKAPIARDQLTNCEACAARCVLRVDGGKLAVFDRTVSESYSEALDNFAPDVRDLSLLRSAARNWHSIHALVDRVQFASSLPESFRFAAPASRGVVTIHAQRDIPRYVIYAYSPVGRPARVLVLSGLSRDDLHRTLGTLRFTSPPAGAAARLPSTSGCT
jgi:hypothetical protein